MGGFFAKRDGIVGYLAAAGFLLPSSLKSSLFLLVDMSLIEPMGSSEMSRLDRALFKYKVMSIDTEFPSSMRDTPRDGSETERYKDLKFNVDVLK
ncbi:hypothetical protein Peur_016373 [Populus x canadensis]